MISQSSKVFIKILTVKNLTIKFFVRKCFSFNENSLLRYNKEKKLEWNEYVKLAEIDAENQGMKKR
jgi:hypothetical protein